MCMCVLHVANQNSPSGSSPLMLHYVLVQASQLSPGSDNDNRKTLIYKLAQFLSSLFP